MFCHKNKLEPLYWRTRHHTTGLSPVLFWVKLSTGPCTQKPDGPVKHRTPGKCDFDPSYSLCLQASARFAYDVPHGVKAGMKWLYLNVLKDAVDQCSTTHWPALLYAVAFLHVTLRQRSTFGPPAWNAPYDCSLADLNRTVRCVQNYADGFERSEVS